MKERRRCRGAVAAANDFGHAELSGVGADYEIMAVDHRQSSPQTPASDRRHGYLRKLAHDGNDLCDAALAAIAAPVALISHVVKIAPRRVRIASAPSDDAANLVILANGSEKVSELVEKGYAQGVFLLWPVERQPGDAFLLVDVVDDEFVIGHEYLLTKNSFKLFKTFKSFKRYYTTDGNPWPRA